MIQLPSQPNDTNADVSDALIKFKTQQESMFLITIRCAMILSIKLINHYPPFMKNIFYIKIGFASHHSHSKPYCKKIV